MRRCILILIAFGIALSAFASSLAQRNPQALASKPNVLLIIMDDLYTHRRGDGTHDLYQNTTPIDPELVLKLKRRMAEWEDDVNQKSP